MILGCANQAGEDNRNVARMAALLAGLPSRWPGQTVNRLCGSGLQAVASAAHAIRAGEGELLRRRRRREHDPGAVRDCSSPARHGIGRPPATADTTVGWRFVNPRMPAGWTISLGETAERVAAQYGITPRGAGCIRGREPAARAGGARRGAVRRRDRGRRGAGPRAARRSSPATSTRAPDVTTRVARRAQAGVHCEGGTVTAGTSSGINDGAAALAIASGRMQWKSWA